MNKSRVVLWAAIVANVAFAVGLILALGYEDPCDMRGEVTAQCAGRTANSIGDAGPITIVGLWVLTDIVLAVVWMITRQRSGESGSNIYRGPSAADDPGDAAGSTSHD